MLLSTRATCAFLLAVGLLAPGPASPLAGRSAAQNRARSESGPFLGQPLPGDTPVVFAPGEVSTEARELGVVFAPDGREIYYTRVVEKLPMLFRRRLLDGRWSAEERLALVAGQPDADHSDPAISPDGQRLYFVSGARTDAFAPGGNIWMARRQGAGWGAAELLPAPVNSDGGELYPIAVADGSLYFASNRSGGLGEQDIYRAQYRDGAFVEAVNLGAPINTAMTEVDPYVSPDERTLVVAARREGNRGALDLYASVRTASGGWTPLTPLGAAVNTELTDYCPMLSPDGQYFFFSRRTAQGGDIYWMRASGLVPPVTPGRPPGK
ncbi:hypothetical protein [Luteitalea sp. TBR-22]|uniref:TolB family protein n=1 Tax=Luteitalea sp. TBR-22 TaxID=2802971 RepID=UPI001EF7458A|nr:hypothetical protein [Luteitalea sp. TBR-22]